MSKHDIWIGSRKVNTLDWRNHAKNTKPQTLAEAVEDAIKFLGFDPFNGQRPPKKISKDVSARMKRRKSGRVKPGSVKIEDAESGDTVEILAGEHKYARAIFERFADADHAWVVYSERSYKIPTKDLVITDLAKTDTSAVNDYHLYHGTSGHKALNIIKTGNLRLPLSSTNNSEKALGTHKNYYMSFARTPASGYLLDKGPGNSIDTNVIIVFDKRILMKTRGTVLKPVDYWGQSDADGRQMGRAKEAEERLFSAKPIVNISKAILEVRIFVKDDDWMDKWLLETVIAAKKSGITTKLFTQENYKGMFHGRENKLDRQHAIEILKKHGLTESRGDVMEPYKAASLRKRDPKGYAPSQMQRLLELVFKKKYTELSERAQSDLRNSRSRWDNDGLLGQFKNELHNMRSGRPAEQDRFNKAMAAMKAKSVEDLFAKLDAKWTKIYEDYQVEEQKGWEEEYKRRQSEKQLDAANMDEAAIKPKSDYRFYTYNSSRTLKFPFKRGRSLVTYTLAKGDKFGLRKSTSSPQTRLIMSKLGENYVFTTVPERTRFLMKHSTPFVANVENQNKGGAVEHVTTIQQALMKANREPVSKSALFRLPDREGAPWRLLSRWMTLHVGVNVTAEQLYAYDRLRSYLNAKNIHTLKNPAGVQKMVVAGARAARAVFGKLPKDDELNILLGYLRALKKGTRNPKPLPILQWHDRSWTFTGNVYRRTEK